MIVLLESRLHQVFWLLSVSWGTLLARFDHKAMNAKKLAPELVKQVDLAPRLKPISTP
jgi:hypothetical protein